MLSLAVDRAGCEYTCSGIASMLRAQLVCTKATPATGIIEASCSMMLMLIISRSNYRAPSW
jgi:hypothetical protein